MCITFVPTFTIHPDTTVTLTFYTNPHAESDYLLGLFERHRWTAIAKYMYNHF